MASFLLLSLLSTGAFTSPVPGPDTIISRQAPTTNVIPTTDAGSSSPINGLLAGVGMIPIIGASISAVSDVITTYEAVLAKTLNVNTSSSETNCAAMTIIFARGTTESGNVGLLAGPPFFDAVENIIGKNNVAVQGVEYGATIEGFLQGGDPVGSQTMADMITHTLTTCPSTAVVMSGYSQGGQLVHNAASLLPASTASKVSSVVIFGDPDFGQPVQGISQAKTMVICHPDDDICLHGDLVLLAHLTYSTNAAQAAAFVATSVGLALGRSRFENGTGT